MVSAQTGHDAPGQTVVSVLSENESQPGSLGKSDFPPPLLSAPAMHSATTQVLAPAGPSHAKATEQGRAPAAASGLSQLEPGRMTPWTLRLYVFGMVVSASTPIVYVPAGTKARWMSESPVP